METKDVSSFWLLWIKLIWIFLYWVLCRHMFSFLFCNSLRMELLGMCIFYFIIFQNGSIILHCHQQCISLRVTLFLVFSLFYFSHFSGNKWCRAFCHIHCLWVHLIAKWLLSLILCFYWVFLLLSCRSFLHVTDKSSIRYMYSNIFSSVF